MERGARLGPMYFANIPRDLLAQSIQVDTRATEALPNTTDWTMNLSK
jgi:hypothetical protein